MHEQQIRLLINYKTIGPKRIETDAFAKLLRPPVILTFDPLTPEVGRFMPLLRGPLVSLTLKSVHSFPKYHVHKFGNR